MDDSRPYRNVKWERQGLLFAPPDRPWSVTHASLPVALARTDGYRVYFASRDAANRSHVGWFDCSLQDQRVIRVSNEPVLAPGPLGTFDDHGVYPASIVEHGGRLFLYTIGWNPGAREPLFYSSIGLAISDDGGTTFERVSPAPIMARSEHDPCLVTSPFVLIDNDMWRMWYVSGFRWTEESDGLHSHYHIKYAESDDGVNWRRDGLVAIAHHDGETNIARPSVVKDGNRYRMWYSRGTSEGYRIGYAESDDGYTWERADYAAGINVPAEGFDAHAQAYPWVMRDFDRWLMLYNGDSFGRAGIGLATSSG
ncbi:MAG TPA: hypothetical protein VGO31_05305 [Microbacteriaceae bacterium]|jgi:hypothetical protein|nr:hypothetical protein [Microbacteriaceae bacterium]